MMDPGLTEGARKNADPCAGEAALPRSERVLLVDDEQDLQQLLAFNLCEAGFEVEAVGTAADALAGASRSLPVVVVLDLMLPDLPGIEVCRRLRAEPLTNDVAVLMLTARSDEYDRVLGFEVGADDYVTKPYSVREVTLRVRALARRVSEQRAARTVGGALLDNTPLRWRDLEVDTGRHRVYASGSELSLRPLEFKLVCLFLQQPERLFTRDDLLGEVWGAPGTQSARTVDTHIRRLRGHLGAHGEAIETVHGYGYRLRRP